MPLPAEVTKVTLLGKILDHEGNPAMGRVTFRMPYPLRDSFGNAIVGPGSSSVTLDGDGEFSIDLIATDDPDLTPQDWVYAVNVSTNVWRDSFSIQVPYDTVGDLQFADIVPVETPPTVVVYATVVQFNAHAVDTTNVHGISDTSVLETTTGSAAKVTAHANATDPHGDRAFTTSAISTHAGASDPHGDRAYADSAVSTHSSDTTSVHGITDTSALVLTGDARLSDARTPTAHASSHASAGSDPVTVTQSQVTGLSAALSGKADASALTAHTSATTSVHGIADTANLVLTNDARLSDARTPTAHNHAGADITSGTVSIARIPTGATGSTVPFGNDARFTDARIPTAHAASHTDGGSDEITITQAQITDLTPAYPMAIQPRAAGFTQAGGVVVARSVLTPSLLTMFLIPFALRVGATLSAMALELTNSTPDATLRLGIYDSDVDLMPGNLVDDFGSFTADTAGVVAAFPSPGPALDASLYWAAVAIQGAAPELRSGSGWTPYVSAGFFLNGTDPGWVNAYYQSVVAGALPSTPTIAAAIGNAPLVGISF